MSKNRFDSYTFSEGKTGIGQLLEITCCREDVEEVKRFLVEKVRTINIPTTKESTVSHGGFSKPTRFNVIQHKYAGSDAECTEQGYWEVLEIHNPPDGRCGFVLHTYSTLKGSVFYEFVSLEDVIEAWGSSHDSEGLKKEKCFIRRVECGYFTPWFYAAGDQFLKGDFVFPDIIDEEDPAFRFGRKFIVEDDFDGFPAVKTCIGSRLIERQVDYYGREKKKYLLVYWDDGTAWNEYAHSKKPRPLDESELWIQETIDQFREFLAGKQTEITIEFRDGSRFVGKFKSRNGKSHNAGGRYEAQLTLENGKRVKGEIDFEPTPEIPTVEKLLHQQAKERGHEIASIDFLAKVRGVRGEKKWAGVYSPPQRDHS